MESLAKYMVETVSSATLRRTVNRAYGALFEAGLSPQKKTRRAIRGMFPEPPGGWDSVAMGTDGQPALTAESHRQVSYVEALENHIRNTFLHDNGATNPRFEPGIARIAYTELGAWPEGLLDWAAGQRPPENRGELGNFVRLMREISAAHADDYDIDLNGMSWAEIKAQFAHGSNGQKVVNEEADGTGSNYTIRWIKSFEEAKPYGKYTEDTQQWCLTQYRKYWNNYTKGNTVKMYFLMSPDIDTVEPKAGPNAPLDEYGLSLLGVGIAPDGTLDCCCTRWNHMHKGSDLAMNEEQLCKLLNVRELSDVCPPFTEEDRKEASGKFEELLTFARSGQAPYGRKVTLVHSFGDVRVYGIPMGPGEVHHIALRSDGSPLITYPIYEEQLFNDFCMVAEYDPYFGISNNGDEDDDDFGDTEPRVIIRYDGQTFLIPENYEDTEYSDVLSLNDTMISVNRSDSNSARPPEGLNFGRILMATAPHEYTQLFDVTKMDWTEQNSEEPEKVADNMFLKGEKLFLVAPDGLRCITDDVHEYSTVFIYGKHRVGLPLGNDEVKTFNIYDTITGECLVNRDDVVDWSALVGSKAVELIYVGNEPGEYEHEIFDADGNILLERTHKLETNNWVSMYIREKESGRVHRAGCAVVEGNKALRGDFIKDQYDRVTIENPRLVNIPDIPWEMMKNPFLIDTDAGMAVIGHTHSESGDYLIAPDGTRYGPYTGWSTTPDEYTVNLFRQRGNHEILVNFVDMRTGKPVLDEKMENTMYKHLRWAVGIYSSNTVLLEFCMPDGKTKAFTLYMPGILEEIDPKAVGKKIVEIDPQTVRRAVDMNRGLNVWMGPQH